MNDQFFDLESHLNSNLILFENKSYSQFFLDIENEISNLESVENIIEVSENHPYRFLVKLFSVWLIKKIPVLISPKEKLYYRSIISNDVTYSSYNLVSNSVLPKNDISFKLNLDETKIYLLTSGSTGAPKIIVHSLSSLIKNAKSFMDFFTPKNTDIFYLNLPLNHVGGLMLVLRSFFNHSKISMDLKEQLDFISLVPTQIEKALLEKSLLFQKLQMAKAILIGGAPLAENTRALLTELKIKFFETYGMSETCSFIVLNNRTLKNQDIYIDENKTVFISSESMFLGTMKNNQFEKRIDEVINGRNYFKTSDMGEMKEDLFYFLGRTDKMIKTGGEKVSLQLIKEIAEKTLNLKDIICIGIDDPKWGDRLVLYYSHDFDLTATQKELLSAQLLPYQVPKNYINLNNFPKEKIKYSSLDLYQFFLSSIIDHKIIDNKKQEWLIVFHGFMENYNDWIFLNSDFSSKYNLLFLNLPGHGRSLSKDFFNLKDIIEKYSDFISNFTNSPNIIGYSLGGRLALQLASILKTKTLTLISSGIGLENEVEKSARKNSDSELFLNIHDQDELMYFFFKWYQNPIFKNFQQHPNYDKEINIKLAGNYKEWQNGINLLTSGVFPTKIENFSLIKKAKYQINYLYGSLDLKYSLEGSDLSQLDSINIRNKCIIEASHNPHKTHQMELIKQLKVIL